MSVSIPVLALFLGLLTSGLASPAGRPEAAQARYDNNGKMFGAHFLFKGFGFSPSTNCLKPSKQKAYG